MPTATRQANGAAVGIVYGIAALADSPSYSAALMEVVPPRSLGGALSMQMLTGWTATVVAPVAFGATLDLMRSAGLGPTASWGAAFGILALGPIVGVFALAPLRAAPRPHPPGAPETERGRREAV